MSAMGKTKPKSKGKRLIYEIVNKGIALPRKNETAEDPSDKSPKV